MKLPTIHLHGAAAERFTSEPIEYAADDLRDVLSMLKSRFPEFKPFLSEHPDFYVVLTDKDKQNPRQVHPEFAATPFQDVEEVHLIPAQQGAGIEAALIAWGFSAMAASIISTVVVNLAIGLVMGAVSRMLAPKPDTSKGSERPDEQPSYLYNGPENVIEQGYQVPVVYGTAMTGSVVVSAGISVEQIAVASTLAATPSGGAQPALPAPVDWQWTGDVGAGG